MNAWHACAAIYGTLAVAGLLLDGATLWVAAWTALTLLSLHRAVNP